MILNIENDSEFEDEFTVIDDADTPVTGLTENDFTTVLYNPSGTEVSNISGGVPITISEIGDGIYKLLFTPDELGNWELIMYNATYFPWGKEGHYKSVQGTADTIFEYLQRIKGLSKENIRLFNPVYNANHRLLTATFKIYDSKTDTESDINAIAEYNVIAEYNSSDELTGFREVKI